MDRLRGLKSLKRMRGLTHSLKEGGGSNWYAGVLDADFENSRFYWNGNSYSTEAVWIAAMGISKVGATYTFTPYEFGPNLAADGGFDSGVDNWAVGPSYTANGNIARAGTLLRATQTVNAVLFRYRRPTTVEVRQGYVFTVDIVATATLNTFTVVGANNTDLGGSENTNVPSPFLGTKKVVHASESTTSYFGVGMGTTAAQPVVTDIDNVIIRKAFAYNGFIASKNAGKIKAVTPATFASAKVLCTLGSNSERNRIRAVYGTDQKLRLIVTAASTEVANLDLGVYAPSTPFVIEWSVADNRFIAALNGGMPVADTVGNIPGMPQLWIGRSYTGETWDGTIQRVTFFADERLPDFGIVTLGDSYSAGAGGVSFAVTANADGRGTVFANPGSGGFTLAQIKADALASTGLMSNGVVVVWDGNGVNGFTDLATAMADYAAIVAAKPNEKFLIISPLKRNNLTAPENANMAALQAALLATYPNHYVNAQAILASHATSPGDDADVAAGAVPTSLLQGDLTHLASAAMGFVWSDATVGAKAILTAKGW